MKFSIKDFFGKFDQIPRKLPIWSQFMKKSLMENFIFCVVILPDFNEKLIGLSRFVIRNNEYGAKLDFWSGHIGHL